MDVLTSADPLLSLSPSSHGEAVGPRRKLYSAVPGRHFVVVRPYTAQAEGEINLYKSDRVKGEISAVFPASTDTNIQSWKFSSECRTDMSPTWIEFSVNWCCHVVQEIIPSQPG